MEEEIDAMPGIKPAFSQPIRDSVFESTSQIDGQIVIKLFGPDGLVDSAPKNLFEMSTLLLEGKARKRNVYTSAAHAK